jgi:hypothetical protein
MYFAIVLRAPVTVEYWLALAFTTIPENSGNFDSNLKFKQVKNALAAVVLQSFSIGNIVGCVQIIPERATSSITGERRNERWIVSSQTYLASLNDVDN